MGRKDSAKSKQPTVIHQCTDCDYWTKYKHNLGRHQMYHDVKSINHLIYQCKDCGYKTDQKEHLKRHRSNHNVKSAQQCRWCSFSANGINLIARHERQHHHAKINISDKEYPFNCAHCPYNTSHKMRWERHVVHHRDHPAEHQCHFCSFSVNNRRSLTFHLKLHDRGMGENNHNNNMGEQLMNSEKDRGNKSAAGSSRNNRRSLISCRVCHSFKTTSRFTLRRHVKRAHPFSLSALPPLSKKRQMNNDRVKSGLKVARKAHQTTSEGIRAGGRAKHPTSSTAIPAKAPKKARAARRYHAADLNQEPSGKEDYRNLNLLETRIQEVSSEAKLRKQFGIIKECKVMLHNIQPLSIEVVTPENTELLPHNKEADQTTDVLNPENEEQLLPNNDDKYQIEDENEVQQERNGKIQLLQSRLKITEERARTINEEAKEISSKKMEVQKKIDEIEGKRALIECNLRSAQSDLKEMITSALESGEEPSEILMQSVEEEVKSLEDERDVFDDELRALREEEKSLDQNLEDARGSHFQVVQVLKALQSEIGWVIVKYLCCK